MRKTITIGELGTIITGKTPPTTNKNYYGDYAVFIKPTDISEQSKYTYETEEMYSKLAAEKYKSSQIPQGAICVPCIGTIGTKMTMAPCDCYTNQSINSIICNENYDNEYVYYLIKHFLPGLKAYNLGTASGREYVSKSNFEKIELVAEQDKTIQIKLGKVLSRYDSLIENYQKQIKLLEEAAQRLYKEWFVDLRFPGHENTKNVNGLPDGWEKRTFGSVIEYEIGGGWGADTKTSNSIIPAYVIRGTDMSALDMGALKELPYRFHQESNYKARQLMHNDIVFEVSGGSKNEGVAKTFLVQQELLDKLDNHVICASFCKLIRLKDSSTAYYIYDTLKEWRASGITTQYDKRSASSIVNYRWKDFLSQQEIVIPNEIVLRDYIKKSELIHSSITKKSSQIRLLTEARDRLLPKLMSGEIEVSGDGLKGQQSVSPMATPWVRK